MATLHDVYKIAVEKGILDGKEISEDGFANILSDDKLRKEYFESAQKKSPGFYSKDFSVFSKNAATILSSYKNTEPTDLQYLWSNSQKQAETPVEQEPYDLGAAVETMTTEKQQPVVPYATPTNENDEISQQIEKKHRTLNEALIILQQRYEKAAGIATTQEEKDRLLNEYYTNRDKVVAESERQINELRNGTHLPAYIQKKIDDKPLTADDNRDLQLRMRVNQMGQQINSYEPNVEIPKQQTAFEKAAESAMQHQATDPIAIANRMIRDVATDLSTLRKEDYDAFNKKLDEDGVKGYSRTMALNSHAQYQDPYITAASNLLLQAENRMKDTKKGEYKVGDVTQNTIRHLLESQEGIATFGLSNLRDAMLLKNVFDKLDTEEALNDPESVLNKKEYALYNAYVSTLAAEFARANDTSVAATAGKITADMVQFVEEMALMGGIWNKANSAVQKALARKLTEKIVQKASGKVAHGFAKAGAGLILNATERGMLAGETAITSLMLPRTYANMLNNQTSVADTNDAIQFDGYKLRIGDLEQNTTADAFLTAWRDQWKEMFTETGGLFRFGSNMIFKNPIARAAFNKLGKTKFGAVLDNLDRALNKAFPKYAKTVAYNGMFEEWLEEVEGAGWDYLFGDKQAYSNFFSKEQQLPMLISFSLPAIFGAGVNAAQEGYFRKKYNNAIAGLQTALYAQGYSEEDVNDAITQIKDNLYTTDINNLPNTIQQMAGSLLGEDAVRARNRFLGRYEELAEKKELTNKEQTEFKVLEDFLNNDKVQMMIDCLSQLAGAETALASMSKQSEQERNQAIERVRQSERDFGQRPIGTNEWGAVYDWQNRTPQEAADFLLQAQSGYLQGVFHRDGIGDTGSIDMNWGHYKGGLQHMIEKHIIRHADFESVDEMMSVLDNLIRTGKVTQRDSDGRYIIKNNQYLAVIAVDENGQWVLTSFDTTKKDTADRTPEEQEKKRNELGLISSSRPNETANADEVGATFPQSESETHSNESSDDESNDKDIQNNQTTQVPEVETDVRSRKLKIKVDGKTIDVKLSAKRLVRHPSGAINWNDSENVILLADGKSVNKKSTRWVDITDAINEAELSRIAKEREKAEPQQPSVQTQPVEEQQIVGQPPQLTPEQIAANVAAAEEQRISDIYAGLQQRVEQKGFDEINKFKPEEAFIWSMNNDGLEQALNNAAEMLAAAEQEKNAFTRSAKVKAWQSIIDKYAPKENSVIDNTTDTGDTQEGKRNDTTTPQNTVSDYKDNSNNLPEQISVENNVDNQGNPIDTDGNLILENIESIDEISDDDFENPTRSIVLPQIPDNVASAIGTQGRPVIIKRSIFKKNADNHLELEPEDSRNILRKALYETNLYGATQPISRPYYRVAIKTETDGNAVVVLDIYQAKDNVEIIGWRKIDQRGLDKMRRQSEREDGQLLILSPTNESGSAAALSALPSDNLSADKDNANNQTLQDGEEKSAKKWRDINYSDINLLDDKYVLVFSTNNNGSYYFATQNDDGTYTRADNKKNIKITSTLDKHIVYVGDKQYILMSKATLKQLAEGTYGYKDGQINAVDVETGQIVKLDRSEIAVNDNGKLRPLYTEKKETFANRLKNTTSLDDALDFVLFSYGAKDENGNISWKKITLRDFINMGRTNLEGKLIDDINNWSTQSLLSRVTDKVIKDLNNDANKANVTKEIVSGLRQAFQLWNEAAKHLGLDNVLDSRKGSGTEYGKLRSKMGSEKSAPSFNIQLGGDSKVLNNKGLNNPLSKIFNGLLLYDKINQMGWLNEIKENQLQNEHKSTIESNDKSVREQIDDLEEQLMDAIDAEDYVLADELQNQINDLKAELQVEDTPRKPLTRAQQLVFNALEKVLGGTKGIKIHRVTNQQARQMLQRRREAELMAVNDRFNQQLDRFAAGEMVGNENFDLGLPSQILIASGLNGSKRLTMNKSVLAKHLQKHGLSVEDIKGLVDALQHPLMVYTWGSKAKSTIAITNITTEDGRKIAVAVKFDSNGNSEINEIASVHGKDALRLISEMNTDKSDFGKDNLKWVDKEQTLTWLSITSPKEVSGTTKSEFEEFNKSDYSHLSAPIAEASNNQEFVSAAKIIQNFENPKLSEQKNSEELKTPNGRVYGWSIGNEIYLTEDGLNPETQIHEYTHLWVKAIRNNNKKAYDSIMRLFKGTPMWETVINDKNYQNLQDEDAILSEVVARYSGKEGAARLEQEAEQMLQNADSTIDEMKAQTFIGRVKKAIADFWKQVADLFGIKEFTSQEEVADRVLYDLLNQTDLQLTEETNFDKKMQEGLDKGGINVLSLQEISELTDTLEDDIRQGNKPLVFERIPYECLQSGIGAQRTLAEALTVAARRSRRASRSLERNGEVVTSEERISRDGSNTQMELDLMNYAKEKGLWLDDPIAAMDERYGKENRIGQGQESTVWVDEERGVVTKVKNTSMYETLEEFLEGMLLNNWLFEDSRQSIIGFGYDKDGLFRVVYETPYVRKEDFKEMTDEQKDEHMAKFGFEPKDDGSHHTYTNGSFEVRDLHNQNIVIAEDGSVAVIDPVVKWETGEHYRERTAEEIEQDERNEELLDNMFDGEEPEFMIADPDNPMGIDEAVRQKIEQLSSDASIADFNPTMPISKLQLNALQRYVSNASDKTEGIRLLQKQINKWRKEHGLSPIDGRLDVRTLLEAASSAVDGKQKIFNGRLRKELEDVLREVIEPIRNSAIYQKYKTEQFPDKNGEMTTHTLTETEFLGRFFQAMDTTERVEQGNPRGIEEFYLRMGVSMAEFVDEFANATFGTMTGKELIDKVHPKLKACTDFALDTAYEAGTITEEEYDTWKQREWYVPERGFEAREQEQREQEQQSWNKKLYESIKNGITGTEDVETSNFSTGSQQIKPELNRRAHGGSSLGTDVFAHIYQNAYNAILTAENNKVRLAMWNLLKENEDFCNEFGIPIPKEVWYERDAEGNWVRKSEGPTAKERREMRELKKDIAALERELAMETDEDRRRELTDEIETLYGMMPYADEWTAKNIWQSEAEKNHTLVKVMVDGQMQEMQFPGILSISNALNDRRNTKWEIQAFRKVCNIMASMCTQFNPTFWTVNVVRDIPWIATKGFNEYGLMFNVRFTQYLADVRTIGTIWKYLWKEDVNEFKSEMAAQFYEFITEGGQTGYAYTPEMTELRNKLRERLQNKGMQHGMLDTFSMLNESSELYTRFAAYRAVLALGYGKEEALKAAKNLSVNFNRRGFGTALGNFFRSFAMFANATVQGAMGVYRMFGGEKTGKAKIAQIARAMIALCGLPFVAGILNGFFYPDDDDDEYKPSDWERMNYICLGSARIPLSEQLKPFYVMGVYAALCMKGQRTSGELASAFLSSLAINFSPISPNINNFVSNYILDESGIQESDWMTEIRDLLYPQGLQNLNQLAEGKNFLGGNLRNEQGETPQYMLGPSSSELSKDLAYCLYAISGGNTQVPMANSAKWDVNPKEVEQFISIFPNGITNTLNSVYSLGKATVNEDLTLEDTFRWKDVPFVNRFYKPKNPDNYRMTITREVSDIVNKYKDVERNLKKLAQGGTDQGSESTSARLKKIINNLSETPQARKEAQKQLIELEQRIMYCERYKKATNPETKQICLNKLAELGGNADALIKWDKLEKRATEYGIGKIEEDLKLYKAYAVYYRAKSAGLDERSFKNNNPNLDYKNADKKEKELTQEMRLFLMEHEGIKKVIDDL